MSVTEGLQKGRAFCAGLALLASHACSTEGTSNVPEACRGEGRENPYQEPACKDALTALCAGLSSESACEAEPQLDFPVQSVRCSWTELVAFSDPESCGGATVSAQCLAVFLAPDMGTCQDPCANPVWSGEGVAALSGDGALVRYGCLADETQLGPDLELDTHICNSSSPPPPAICDCIPQMCEALE